MTNLTIVYYSSTGQTWQVANAVEEGARAAGAQTRLRKVRELAPPETIAAKPGWQAHLDATREVPRLPEEMLAAARYQGGRVARFGAALAAARA